MEEGLYCHASISSFSKEKHVYMDGVTSKSLLKQQINITEIDDSSVSISCDTPIQWLFICFVGANSVIFRLVCKWW